MDSLWTHWYRARPAADARATTHASFEHDYEMPVVDFGTVVERVFLGIDDCVFDSVFNVHTDLGNVSVHDSGDETSRFILAETFAFENGLSSSMTSDEVVSILGEPVWRRDDVMTFAVQDSDDGDHSYQDNIRLFFRDDQLTYVWLLWPFSC